MRAFNRAGSNFLITARSSALAAVLATGAIVVLPGNPSAAAEGGLSAQHGTAPAMGYVINEFSSTMSAISLSTNSVTGTISTAATNGIGANPTSIVATPNGRQAYVLNSYGAVAPSFVNVVDAATGSVVATIPLKAHSGYSDLFFSPSGDRAYVLGGNNAGSFIASIDTRTHVVTNFPNDGHAADFALSPDGTKIYTADRTTGGITVLDAATGKHLAAFSGGDKGVDQVLASPDGTRLYLRHDSDATLREIDTATGKTVATVTLGPVGTRSMQFALSPNGATLYSVDISRTGPSAIAVDLGSGMVSAPISLPDQSGGTPDYIAVSPNGATVYVTGRLLGKAYAIDASSWTIQSTTMDWGNPVVAFSPDSTKAYLTDHNAVDVVDPVTGTVTGKFDTGLEAADVVTADNGARALVLNSGSDDLSVIDTADNVIRTTVPGGQDEPYYQVLTPNGRFAYLMGMGDSILKVDLAARKVVAIIPVGGSERWFAVSPNGRELYVAKVTGKMDVISTATNKVTAEIDTGDGTSQPIVSPDGSKVYVPLYKGVAVIDTATNAVATTIPVSGYIYGLTLSPDGSKAYANLGGGGMPVLDTATGTVSGTLALPAGTNPGNPVFSPNGELAYVTGTNVVYVVDTTTNAITATIPINNAFQVMVSRDGTKAYVVGGRGGSSTFSIVDTATNTVTETTPLSGWVDNSTALSADGSTAYLVCQSLKNAKAGAVYVINTATGALTHTITVGDYPQQIALVQ